MAKYTLSVEIRKIAGRKVKSLRKQGLIPSSVYGKSVKSVSLQVNVKDFLKVYKEVGESTLLYLKVKSETDPRPVLVSEVSIHPSTRQLLHVSFHQVDLKEKVTVPVPVDLIGQSPAEKDKLGILVQQTDNLEVEALPTDMPEHLDADVSGLTEVGQAVYAKDIKLTAKLTLKSDPETIIAKIEPLAKEEKVEAPPVEEAPVEGAGEAPTPTETTEESKPEVKPNA